MKAVELLAELRSQGFTIMLHDGGIAVLPASNLDPGKREVLQAHLHDLLKILFREVLDTAMERIVGVYPYGLRDRLRATKPDVLCELDRLEDQINNLAVAGEMKGAADTLLRWESAWLSACTKNANGKQYVV
jgi:hypothetical protein